MEPQTITNITFLKYKTEHRNFFKYTKEEQILKSLALKVAHS
jgi:hypothetical protein